MFVRHEVSAGIGHAVTDRFGGASRAPYDELNLADHVGDRPDRVAANRSALAAALGVPAGHLVTLRQVHGNAVHVAEQPLAVPPEADGVVSRVPGLVLAVLVADCTPVLLWDSAAGVVGAAHAGRRGLAAGVVQATVAAMADLGARVERMAAVVGPAICPEHYAVPAALRAEVAACAPESFAATADGQPALDIRRGLLAQLAGLGLAGPAVAGECTVESPGLYSYRRDGVTGRFAGLVWRVGGEARR